MFVRSGDKNWVIIELMGPRGRMRKGKKGVVTREKKKTKMMKRKKRKKKLRMK